MENLNCLAEEVKNVRFTLIQDKKGIKDLQAQVANSTRTEEKYAANLADLEHQIASIQSNIRSYHEHKFTHSLEGPALQDQINTIRSEMDAKLEIELKRMKDELIGAMNLERLQTSQVRFAETTAFHGDPSLQHDVQQKCFACSNPFTKAKSHQSPSTSKYLTQSLFPGNPDGIKHPSVRKDREQMNAQSKDEDQNLLLALQHHVRFLTSTKRDKNDRLQLATAQDLEILPTLDPNFCNFPLPINAPYLLTCDQVSISFADDEDVRHAFVKFFEQKACQYGLPFVGLAREDGPSARDWNERISMLLFDTLLFALQAGEYPQYNCCGPSGPDANRLRKLLDCHLKYQLELIDRVNRDGGFVQASRKSDRISGRRAWVQQLLIYSKLFEDDRLFSSDESMDNPLDEDKIRHIPPWRSQLATALVKRVDAAYKELRRNEYPKRSGRKPSKRITPLNDPVISDAGKWPNKLPEDCYSQGVANLVPKFKSPNTSERKTPQSNSLANDEHTAIRIAPLRFAPGDRKVLHQWKKLGSPCAPGFKKIQSNSQKLILIKPERIDYPTHELVIEEYFVLAQLHKTINLFDLGKKTTAATMSRKAATLLRTLIQHIKLRSRSTASTSWNRRKKDPGVADEIRQNFESVDAGDESSFTKLSKPGKIDPSLERLDSSSLFLPVTGIITLAVVHLARFLASSTLKLPSSKAPIKNKKFVNRDVLSTVQPHSKTYKFTQVTELPHKPYKFTQVTELPHKPIQTDQILGQGGFGTVYLARSTRQPTVSAVKVTQNFGQLLEARQEIQLHSELSQHEHYNILPLLQTMETPSYFVLVTPYMSRGTLEYQIRDRCHFIHNPSHILLVFRQIASAVAFCHEKGVAHRDIKPANILCNFDLQVYLGDFGLATTEYDSKSFWCGTRAYMGPVLVSFVDQPAGTLKASQALKNLGAVQVDFINQLQHLLIQLQLLHTQLCSPRRIVQPSGVARHPTQPKDLTCDSRAGVGNLVQKFESPKTSKRKMLRSNSLANAEQVPRPKAAKSPSHKPCKTTLPVRPQPAKEPSSKISSPAHQPS
ncbi:hypothetical protein PCANC_15558 [Puccinia coronata f. sp. avenae]|uniref:Protein kinase domain-containing protein n=1 Tax=Puccinia coronata f. sp. avenae TaxID=200324 RepID=A0A2N5SX87_9BASI|nr:hypothetical protein PCANC_15558 [Puccinia coronata f. sp. avenae]